MEGEGSPKAGSRVLVILGIVVLLILGGGVFAWKGFGFFGGAYQNEEAVLSAESEIQSQPSPTPESEASSAAIPAKKMVIVDLKPQSGSTESGKAKVVEVDEGKVTVSIEVTGVPKGVAQPAHIHAGKCAPIGTVKYPLTDIVDGSSETTIEVSFERLISELPLAINIHKSQAQSKTYVSCGEIKETKVSKGQSFP